MSSSKILTIGGAIGTAALGLYFLNAAMEKPFLNPRVENGTKWAIGLASVAVTVLPLMNMAKKA